MSSTTRPRLEEAPARLWPHEAPDSSSESDQDVAAFSNDNNDDHQEEEDTAPSDSEDEGPTRSRRRQRIHFDVQQLQTVYHLPLKTAAERLGVCEAALKRICRRNRIHKWPYRQLASVHRRIADLKERRAANSASLLEGCESHERRGEQDPLSFVSAEELDFSLRQLEEEQTRIIGSAHQTRRTSNGRRPKAASSTQQKLTYPQQQRQRLVSGELPAIRAQDFRSKIADLPMLDLRQVDRDFPLLFLANVCESVRAYNS